ncbi:MAG: aminodeoxychorismate synthase component I [Pseudomonadota bacterium]|nr:aminodeoxychorismate synthase component I [Pseudomonadota bacterium]
MRSRFFALLDASNGQDPGGWTRLLDELEEDILCRVPGEIATCLQRIDACRAHGLHVVGLFNYELGYALHPRLAGLASGCGNLFRALAFRRRANLDAVEVEHWLKEQTSSIADPCGVAGVRHAVPEARYRQLVRRIQDYIAAGDCYQVNLTFGLDFDVFGDPLALYRRLRERQKVGYGAFIALDDGHILSFSPELFVRRADATLITKPMKGTMHRGGTPPADDALRDALFRDEKNRAEHVMIVDLLRNDLGRLARIGGVRVDRLFEIEDYATLFQMTSTIRGEIDESVTLGRVLDALFPCGSVTGAPKLRAMEIIAETESRPRGLYCGAIGALESNGDFCFNVPIRTLVLDGKGQGTMGIGSAIVFDSRAVDEYAECNLKAKFLTGLHPGFRLIETMRCEANGFESLELHLARLTASASYFGFSIDCAALRIELDRLRASGVGPMPWKVRVLLSKDGEFVLERLALVDGSARDRLILATRRTDSRDILLRHKTTARALYDEEFARARRAGYCDVLFCNQRGEVTEASRGNVFVRLDGDWFTPPLSCGLLPGVMRGRVLCDPRYSARERTIRLEDLPRAQRMVLTNSVRGILDVRFDAKRRHCAPAMQH